MNEDLLKKIYEQKGFKDFGTFDKFKTDMMSSPDIRKKVFEQKGFAEHGTYEQFEKDLAIQPPTLPPLQQYQKGPVGVARPGVMANPGQDDERLKNFYGKDETKSPMHKSALLAGNPKLSMSIDPVAQKELGVAVAQVGSAEKEAKSATLVNMEGDVLTNAKSFYGDNLEKKKENYSKNPQIADAEFSLEALNIYEEEAKYLAERSRERLKALNADKYSPAQIDKAVNTYTALSLMGQTEDAQAFISKFPELKDDPNLNNIFGVNDKLRELSLARMHVAKNNPEWVKYNTEKIPAKQKEINQNVEKFREENKDIPFWGQGIPMLVHPNVGQTIKGRIGGWAKNIAEFVPFAETGAVRDWGREMMDMNPKSSDYQGKAIEEYKKVQGYDVVFDGDKISYVRDPKTGFIVEPTPEKMKTIKEEAKGKESQKRFNAKPFVGQTADVLLDMAPIVALTYATGGTLSGLLGSATARGIGVVAGSALQVRGDLMDQMLLHPDISPTEAEVYTDAIGFGIGLLSLINPMEAPGLAKALPGILKKNSARLLNKEITKGQFAWEVTKDLGSLSAKETTEELLQEWFQYGAQKGIDATQPGYGRFDIQAPTGDDMLEIGLVSSAVAMLGGAGSIRASRNAMIDEALSTALDKPKIVSEYLGGMEDRANAITDEAAKEQALDHIERIRERWANIQTNVDSVKGLDKKKRGKLAGLIADSNALESEASGITNSTLLAAKKEEIKAINDEIKALITPGPAAAPTTAAATTPGELVLGELEDENLTEEDKIRMAAASASRLSGKDSEVEIENFEKGQVIEDERGTGKVVDTHKNADGSVHAIDVEYEDGDTKRVNVFRKTPMEAGVKIVGTKATATKAPAVDALKDVESTKEAFKGIEAEDLKPLVELAGGKVGPAGIATAYHAAKADDSNPELVAAVEKLLGTKPAPKPAPPPTPKTDQTIPEGYVSYEEARKIVPTSKFKDIPEGEDEGSMEARSRALREQENTPPTFQKHPVGTRAVDKRGEVYELRDLPFDELVVNDDGGLTQPTVDKYAKWLQEGNEMPPITGVENFVAYGGKVKVSDGRHRIAAAKKAGLKTVPVWVNLTDPVTQTRPVMIEDDIKQRKSKSTTTASIPVMITKKMEADLRERGYTQSQIDKLTPQEANDILSKPAVAKPPKSKTRSDALKNRKKDNLTHRDRKRVLLESRSDGLTLDESYEKAGYTKIGQIWVSPDISDAKLEMIPDALWQAMEDAGIGILSFTNAETVHGVAREQEFDDRTTSEIQLSPHDLEKKGLIHVISHEIGHAVYRTLSEDQKKGFENFNAVSAYVEGLQSGVHHSGASNSEENFVENFAADLTARLFGESRFEVQDQYKELLDTINAKYGKSDKSPKLQPDEDNKAPASSGIISLIKKVFGEPKDRPSKQRKGVVYKTTIQSKTSSDGEVVTTKYVGNVYEDGVLNESEGATPSTSWIDAVDFTEKIEPFIEKDPKLGYGQVNSWNTWQELLLEGNPPKKIDFLETREPTDKNTNKRRWLEVRVTYEDGQIGEFDFQLKTNTDEDNKGQDTKAGQEDNAKGDAKRKKANGPRPKVIRRRPNAKQRAKARSKKYHEALSTYVGGDAEGIVMQYLLENSIHSGVIRDLYGVKLNNKNGTKIDGEVQSRLSLIDNKTSKSETLDKIAEEIWELIPEELNVPLDKVKEAIENILQKYNSREKMAADIITRFVEPSLTEEEKWYIKKHPDAYANFYALSFLDQLTDEEIQALADDEYDFENSPEYQEMFLGPAVDEEVEEDVDEEDDGEYIPNQADRDRARERYPDEALTDEEIDDLQAWKKGKVIRGEDERLQDLDLKAGDTVRHSFNAKEYTVVPLTDAQAKAATKAQGRYYDKDKKYFTVTDKETGRDTLESDRGIYQKVEGDQQQPDITTDENVGNPNGMSLSSFDEGDVIWRKVDGVYQEFEIMKNNGEKPWILKSPNGQMHRADPYSEGFSRKTAQTDESNSKFTVDDTVIFTDRSGTEYEASFRGYVSPTEAVIVGKQGSGLNQMQVPVGQLKAKGASKSTAYTYTKEGDIQKVTVIKRGPTTTQVETEQGTRAVRTNTELFTTEKEVENELIRLGELELKDIGRRRIPQGKGAWRKQFNELTDPFEKSYLLESVAADTESIQDISDIIDILPGMPDESRVVTAILHKGVNRAENIDKILSGDFSDFTKDNVRQRWGETPSTPSKAAKRKIRDEKLDADNEEDFELLKKQLKNRDKLTIGGIDPEAVATATRIVSRYVKKGIYKFSDMIEDLYAKMGEDISEFFDALKSAYGSYINTQATDEESDQMDQNIRKFTYESLTSKFNEDVSDQSGDSTGDSQGLDDQAEGNKGPIRGPNRGSSRGSGGKTSGRGNKTDEQTTSSKGDGGLLTPPLGKQSDLFLHPKDPGSGPKTDSPGDADGRGNSTDSSTGPNADGSGIASIDSGTKKASGGFQERTRLAKKKQDEVEDVPVILMDEANIRETLPLLLDEQQDDVIKAEHRFFSPEHKNFAKANGKGMMFTNATGTGKSFVALGIVKRFVKQGKGNILIIAPSQPKLTEWRRDAGMLNLDLVLLKNTKDAGVGFNATTFHNFTKNQAILTRDFDLIIYDESHHVMEDKDGNESSATNVHRMMGNMNERQALNRLQSVHPIWKKHNEVLLEYRKVADSKLTPNLSYAERQQKIKEIQGELDLIKEKQDKLLPAMRQRAKEAVDKTKVVFLSATPFKAIKNIRYANGFLFDWGNETIVNNRGSRIDAESQFLLANFGSKWQWNRHRLEPKDPANEEAVAMQEIAFAEKLMDEGVMSGRPIESNMDYSRDFPKVTGFNSNEFNRAFSSIYNYENDEFARLREPAKAVFFNHNYTIPLFESLKTSMSIDRIKKQLDLGRKVVVFHRRRESSVRPPFETIYQATIDNANEILMDPNTIDKAKEEALSAINQAESFKERFAALFEYEQTLDYRPVVEQLKDAFPEMTAFLNGDVNKKGEKDAAIKNFNNDASPIKIIVIQENSGREGISLHDTTGKHQRALMSMSMPNSTTTALQVEGRIYRIGQESNAIIEYPVLGIDLETAYFGSNLNKRLGTTENLAMGKQSRNLIRSFAEGILFNSTTEDPHTGQGEGGKEYDKRIESSQSAFKEARLVYASNQKVTGRRDQRAGEDFYATPEPLGQKMVEWSGNRVGDHTLEPSAGNGAISKWFPNTVASTAIEPSFELYSMAQTRTGGSNAKVLNTRFEDHNIINKYDTIVMNPPFGVGGKTAMDHLEKAFKHLRDGGRVVALVPVGQMDKRLEQFLYGTDEKGKPLNPNAYLRKTILLPSVTFQQQGTQVGTQIVIIDKVLNSDEAPDNEGVTDLRNIKSIDQLFDNIEFEEAPERIARNIEDAADTPTAEARPAAQGDVIAPITEHKDTRNNDVWHSAKFTRNIPRPEYERISGIAKKHGGKYFGFTRSFLFKTKQGAEAFRNEVNGNPPQFSMDPLLAPNGKPSNLTPDQYAQVRTPEFKKWFGDWEGDPTNASKAVDENGEPLVVYHGSDKAFNTFNAINPRKKAGIYLTDNKDIADTFGALTKAFFLNIRMPKKVGLEGTTELNIGQKSELEDEGFDGISGTMDGSVFDVGADFIVGEYVAFSPTQIKSATDNTGAFDPNNNDIRFSLDEAPTVMPDLVNGFYSPLEKIIRESKADKLPVKQWIEKFAKGEEAKWTGLTEWLGAQEGSVTKSDILDFLEDNRVEIKEVVKAAVDENQEFQKSKAERMEDIRNKIRSLPGGYDLEMEMDGEWALYKEGEQVDDADEESIPEEVRMLGMEHWELDNEYDEEGNFGDTKYPGYTLPGHKTNYKEVLVTLPKKEIIETYVAKEIEDTDTWEVIIKETGKKAVYASSTPMPYFEAVNEAALLNKRRASVPKREEATKFQSQHWSEPNILVHLRMDTRIDANGDKVLFLEEVQSDWAQKGRKEGFLTPEREAADKRIAALNDAQTNAEVKLRALMYRRRQEFGANTSIQDRIDAGDEDIISAYDAEQRIQKERLVAIDGIRGNTWVVAKPTPIAPFVTDTSAWTKLALKVATKEAVKQGATKIAWTTGDQQNERYAEALVKVIDEIKWSRQVSTGNKIVTIQPIGREYIKFAVDKDTGKIINDLANASEYVGQSLDDLVGKSIAEKIIDDVLPSGELSGNGLKIKSKGMPAFYGDPEKDKLGIVGSVAKSMFGDVGTIQLQTTSTPNDTQNQVLNFRDWVWTNKDDNYTYDDAKNDIENNSPVFKEYKKAIDDKSILQHSVTITPELANQVKAQGLPLFSIQAAETAIKSGNPDPNAQLIIKLKDAGATVEENLRQFADLWIDLVEKQSKPFINRGLELIKGTEYDTGDPRKDLANAIAEKAAKSKKDNKLINWVKDFWKRVGKIMKINVTPEQLQDMTVGEYLDIAATQMIYGNEVYMELLADEAKAKTDNEPVITPAAPPDNVAKYESLSDDEVASRPVSSGKPVPPKPLSNDERYLFEGRDEDAQGVVIANPKGPTMERMLQGYAGPHRRVLETLVLLFPTLKTAGITITVHESKDSYANAVVANGGTASQAVKSGGFYHNKEVHINLAKADLKENTALHEAFHPIIRELLVKNKPVFKKFIAEILADPEMRRRYLDEFSQNYQYLAGQENAIEEEMLVEASADIVMKRVLRSLNDMPDKLFDRILKYIKDVLGDAYGKLADFISDKESFAVFANGLAEAISKGMVVPVNAEINDNIRTIVNNSIQHSKQRAGNLFGGQEQTDLFGLMNNQRTLNQEKATPEALLRQKYFDLGYPAPNGQKSNLTPDQYYQVRTPEFKAWFGDWEGDSAGASKVVDENGEPLVVYHGTAQYGFQEFKGNKPIFFSDSKGTADSYQDKADGQSKGTYGVFLNSRNIEKIDANGSDFASIVVEEDTMTAKKTRLSVSGIYESVFGFRFPSIVTEKQGAGKTDGVVVTNVKDDLLGSTGKSPSNVYVVVAPTQIKSATDNTGAFDGNNPDIRFSMEPHDPVTSPEFKRWFGNSKVVNDDGSPRIVYHGSTNFEPITKFRKGAHGLLGPGTYFTNDERYATDYADKRGAGNGQVIDAYLHMQNPYIVIGPDGSVDLLKKLYGEAVAKNRQSKQGNINYLVTARDTKKIRDLGHDGIIYKIKDIPDAYTEYVVFEPTQVKSASKNTGQFSARNPDIRFSMEPDTVKDDTGKPIVFYHGTGAEFSDFDSSKQNSVTGHGDFGKGFYLSASPGVGRYYSLKFEEGRRVVKEFNVIAKKPFEINISDEVFDEDTKKRFLGLRYIQDYERDIIKDATKGELPFAYKKISKEIGDRRLSDIFQENGFDAVYVNRTLGNETTEKAEVVVFDKTQIKTPFQPPQFSSHSEAKVARIKKDLAHDILTQPDYNFEPIVEMLIRKGTLTKADGDELLGTKRAAEKMGFSGDKLLGMLIDMAGLRHLHRMDVEDNLQVKNANMQQLMNDMRDVKDEGLLDGLLDKYSPGTIKEWIEEVMASGLAHPAEIIAKYRRANKAGDPVGVMTIIATSIAFAELKREATFYKNLVDQTGDIEASTQLQYVRAAQYELANLAKTNGSHAGAALGIRSKLLQLAGLTYESEMAQIEEINESKAGKGIEIDQATKDEVKRLVDLINTQQEQMDKLIAQSDASNSKKVAAEKEYNRKAQSALEARPIMTKAEALEHLRRLRGIRASFSLMLSADAPEFNVLDIINELVKIAHQEITEEGGRAGFKNVVARVQSYDPTITEEQVYEALVSTTAFAKQKALSEYAKRQAETRKQVKDIAKVEKIVTDQVLDLLRNKKVPTESKMAEFGDLLQSIEKGIYMYKSNAELYVKWLNDVQLIREKYALAFLHPNDPVNNPPKDDDQILGELINAVLTLKDNKLYDWMRAQEAELLRQKEMIDSGRISELIAEEDRDHIELPGEFSKITYEDGVATGTEPTTFDFGQMDRQIRENKKELEKLKSKFRKKGTLEQYTYWLYRLPRGTLGTAQAMIDLSMIAIQGFKASLVAMVRQPGALKQAFTSSLKTFYDEMKKDPGLSNEIHYNMTQNKYYNILQAAGLDLTSPDSHHFINEMVSQDDAFDLLHDKTKGRKNIAAKVARGALGIRRKLKNASNASFATYLNILSFEAAVSYIEKVKAVNDGKMPSVRELAVKAHEINSSTGRTKRAPGATEGAAYFFWAPKLYLSQILNVANIVADPVNFAGNMTKLQIAIAKGDEAAIQKHREMVRVYGHRAVNSLIFATSSVGLYMIRVMLAKWQCGENASVNTNIAKPSFLKINCGELTLDPTGNHRQWLALGARAWAGFRGDPYLDYMGRPVTTTEQIMDLMQYKFNPLVSTGFQMWDGTDFLGRRRQPDDQSFLMWQSRAEVLLDHLKPIGVGNVVEIAGAKGMDGKLPTIISKPMVMIEAIQGFGVTRIDEEEENARKAIEKEVRDKKKAAKQTEDVGQLRTRIGNLKELQGSFIYDIPAEALDLTPHTVSFDGKTYKVFKRNDDPGGNKKDDDLYTVKTTQSGPNKGKKYFERIPKDKKINYN